MTRVRYPVLLFLALVAVAVRGEIRRDPNGVNVSAQAATTVFITFGGLDDQVPIEAAWCGRLVPATPDLGMKCDPSVLFGRLPIRFDQSRLGGSGTVFTDIMSIPPSVSRRAYQAAERGETSTFFYVRRFESLRGGPDEYVFVTCRMAGGGARVPLALLDVTLEFEGEETVRVVGREQTPPTWKAEIAYNGTGRLQGRWEVVQPGDETPEARDLLTEASLPPAERGLQRQYTLLDRFNIFLPPTGRVTLDGPDPEQLPVAIDGLYLILLRVEATADKEGDSSLDKVGAGTGTIHSGGVAGFPMPVLRYFVGSAEGAARAMAVEGFGLLQPESEATMGRGESATFTWSRAPEAVLYRLDVATADGEVVFSALVQQGIGTYRAPPFLDDRLGEDGRAQWRVAVIGADSEEMTVSPWRSLRWVAGADD